MISKRHERIVVEQGQPYYQCDAPHIATIIQEELEVSTDEVTEKQATGLINITGMSYEMGMFAGLKLAVLHSQFLSRIVILN